MDCTELKPGLRRGKPTSNGLDYDAAMQIVFLPSLLSTFLSLDMYMHHQNKEVTWPYLYSHFSIYAVNAFLQSIEYIKERVNEEQIFLKNLRKIVGCVNEPSQPKGSQGIPSLCCDIDSLFDAEGFPELP
jgi:hypothetical protein